MLIASWVCLVVAVLAYWARNARAQGAAKVYDVLDAIVWHKAMLAVARVALGLALVFWVLVLFMGVK